MLRCKTTSAKLLANGGPVSNSRIFANNEASRKKIVPIKYECAVKERSWRAAFFAIGEIAGWPPLQHSMLLCWLSFSGALSPPLSVLQQLCLCAGFRAVA